MTKPGRLPATQVYFTLADPKPSGRPVHCHICLMCLSWLTVVCTCVFCCCVQCVKKVYYVLQKCDDCLDKKEECYCDKKKVILLGCGCK